LNSLETKQASTTTAFEASQQQGYDQAVKQIKADARQLVQSDPDAYEAIRAAGTVNDVVELIEQTFKEDGILMSTEDAANAVEEHLVEEAMKYARLKKTQARMRPTTATTTQQESVPGSKQPPKTLTNAAGAQRPMTSRERAIAAFHNKLK
jgi:hypothetical protein